MGKHSSFDDYLTESQQQKQMRNLTEIRFSQFSVNCWENRKASQKMPSSPANTLDKIWYQKSPLKLMNGALFLVKKKSFTDRKYNEKTFTIVRKTNTFNYAQNLKYLTTIYFVNIPLKFKIVRNFTLVTLLSGNIILLQIVNWKLGS